MHRALSYLAESQLTHELSTRFSKKTRKLNILLDARLYVNYNDFIMERRQRKAGEASSEVLQDIPLACQDETAAVEFMEKQRWGDRPVCPHCDSDSVYQMNNTDGKRNKRFLWRCHTCKKQYTVRIGTVFEDSRIPLRKWCYAFWKACSSKKGISALQISRECNLAYKSALFMMHRIRYAMSGPEEGTPLTGTVEVDETYVGGKPRPGDKNTKRGRGTRKQPVMVLVERDGSARGRVLSNVTSKTLRAAINENVMPFAKVNTDDFLSYRFLGREWPGGHSVVKHSAGEYSRGDAHTNTAESFFALLKRGVYGTFHAVSKKHLHRYVDEFVFRWNTRKVDDGKRLAKAIKAADGKRLLYCEPINKTA